MHLKDLVLKNNIWNSRDNYTKFKYLKYKEWERHDF